MSKTFDELPAAGTLSGVETMAVNQAGLTKYLTINQIVAAAWTLAAETPAATASSAVAAHNSAYAHTDIAHANRTALDAVSGTNTGDQDLSGYVQKSAPVLTAALALPNASDADPDKLDWYKEGTWTPVDGSTAGLTITDNGCRYTRIGNLVFLFVDINYPSTADATSAQLGGLPFINGSIEKYGSILKAFMGTYTEYILKMPAGAQYLRFVANAAGERTNANVSNARWVGMIVYTA